MNSFGRTTPGDRPDFRRFPARRDLRFRGAHYLLSRTVSNVAPHERQECVTETDDAARSLRGNRRAETLLNSTCRISTLLLPHWGHFGGHSSMGFLAAPQNLQSR